MASQLSFSDHIQNSDVPVLVDFWADWCGPCKTMNPILQELASRQKGKLKVLKVNVDKSPQAAQHFQVQSIPTMLLFDKGKVVWRQAGAMPLPQLEQKLAQWLGK